LREAFDYCREGDVASLDRLGRSLRELITWLVNSRGGARVSGASRTLDTTTAGGRRIFHAAIVLSRMISRSNYASVPKILATARARVDTAAGPGRSTRTGRSWPGGSRRRANTRWRRSAPCWGWGGPPCTGTLMRKVASSFDWPRPVCAKGLRLLLLGRRAPRMGTHLRACPVWS
jgi:hypothetical protein